MNRRFGAVAIVLMALAALAGVLSFVFFSQPIREDSPRVQGAQSEPSSLTPISPSTSASTGIINPDPTEPLPVPNSLPLVVAAPRADQPAKLKPQPPSRSPDWKLLDWSLKPLAEKPGVQLRASSFLATGKHPFVRVEEEIQILPNGEAKVLRTAEMVGDQIIVKLPEGSPAEEIQSLAAKLGGQAAAKPFAPDTWLVAVPRRLEAVPEALAGSTNSGVSIDYVEPNHLVRPMATPNDLNFVNGNQWHLNNTAQLGRDIRAPIAWDSRTDAAGVIVAVIDTGVRYTHEDLAGNMWVNPGEIAGNGIDDDRNGYIDDVHGIDEFSNDGNPMDENGHGTHCAGLAGAVGNNGKGVTGVAWTGIRIMALRFIGTTGSISDNVRCIDYALARGVRVLNASYGSTFRSDTGSNSEAAAIYRAQQAGVMMVAAAGNNGTSNDNNPFFPASYVEYVERVSPRRAFPLQNIIAVGATDRNDGRASFSNFGDLSVDLMAPGVSMWSTTFNSDSSYGSGQGTSFAAPVVAGGLALLRASYPNDSVAQLRTKILAGVDPVPALEGLCDTGGRLNLAKLIPAATPSTLATAWHRPAYQEPLLGNITMRLPAYEVAPGAPFTAFHGLRKLNNPGYGTADQTGGTLFYRTGTSGSWSSLPLTFDKNDGDYQFWKATIPGTATAGVVQYYFRLDFSSGVAPIIYLYGSDNQSTATTDESAAQAQPFSLRDRVSWVFHAAGDRTLNANTAALQAKVGYVAPDGASYRGATAGVLYYTLDGNFPVGSMGNPGNGSTFTIPFQYLRLQDDTSAAGDAMIWEAVMTNLPVGTLIRYTLGFWNDETMEEQFSGYRAVGSLSQGEFTIPWSFRAAYPASLPNSDTDGDGVPALVEYALGTNSTGSALPTLNSPSNGVLTLTAIVRTNDPGLNFTAHGVTNLGDYANTNLVTRISGTASTNTNIVPAGFQWQEFRFTNNSSRAFLKLTIQQP